MLLVPPPLGESPVEGWMKGNRRLVLNEQIFESGVVGVAIQGGVEIRTVVSQGCQPIGERYVVTKVDRERHSGTWRHPSIGTVGGNLEGFGGI